MEAIEPALPIPVGCRRPKPPVSPTAKHDWPRHVKAFHINAKSNSRDVQSECQRAGAIFYSKKATTLKGLPTLLVTWALGLVHRRLRAGGVGARQPIMASTPDNLLQLGGALLKENSHRWVHGGLLCGVVMSRSSSHAPRVSCE